MHIIFNKKTFQDDSKWHHGSLAIGRGHCGTRCGIGHAHQQQRQQGRIILRLLAKKAGLFYIFFTLLISLVNKVAFLFHVAAKFFLTTLGFLQTWFRNSVNKRIFSRRKLKEGKRKMKNVPSR